MRTITHEGERYVIAESSDGPVLVPARELVQVGGKVRYNSKVYALVAEFTDGLDASMRDIKYAVLRATFNTKRPYSVVSFDSLRPVE